MAYATLKYPASYTIDGKRFERGVPERVGPELAEILRQTPNFDIDDDDDAKAALEPRKVVIVKKPSEQAGKTDPARKAGKPAPGRAGDQADGDPATDTQGAIAV